MNKGFWAVIAIIVVVFGGLLLFKGDKANAPNASNAKPTTHLAGKGTTGVTLIEYGDYQCPFCGQYYPIVKQVQQKYGDEITFQFRNLPLLQIHQNAFAGARAAEAASNQGKFWEMHDLLYENQASWSNTSNVLPVFQTYAKQLGLNADQFKKDFSSAATNDVINADITEFDKTKQEKSTPTFFLDGKKITPRSVDEFSKLIDDEIAAKSAKT
ncbi:MAG TPA: thioredoxin domain-containing protein [Patescibacteria group bacterium]|nr:thioredoxin domain-containing protein [Patescibacteria group bacterium]